MSVSTKRLNRILAKVGNAGLYFAGHGGSYRIGRVPSDYDAEPGDVVDFHAISTTGHGFEASSLKEAEAFAHGLAVGLDRANEARETEASEVLDALDRGKPIEARERLEKLARR